MNIAEAKQQIEDTVDGYLTRDETGAYLIPPEVQRPLFLLGAPGIGKTAIVGQVARELGIGLVSYSMTHHTRQSALGLPFIVHHNYGGEEFEVSEYTMSEIIASVYDYQEQTGHHRGILFLDEVNCVSETLYPSMLQFLQFKTFGRHKVPDGWIVVCAGNPPEYNRSVFDFDVVTLDRLRKINVEPDLDAWSAYALKTGVHPAVLSYLDIKPDHFYSVESTPDGKVFVTARGWDDLSRIIKLFEKTGKRIDAGLIAQFLQDDTISERFAQYYQLFVKYRSDYQVGSILQGESSELIRQRARDARFDERLALMRLMLDALESKCSTCIEEERVISLLRDALRQEKEALCGATPARDTLEVTAKTLEENTRKAVKAKQLSDTDARPALLASARLRAYCASCDEEQAQIGEAAFEAIQSRYMQEVEAFKASVEEASSSIDNSFDFLEAEFGEGREMAAFVAELTARPGTAEFISNFGSDAYYKRNETVLAGSAQANLIERMRNIDLEAAEVEAQELERKQAAAKGCGGCCGC